MSQSQSVVVKPTAQYDILNEFRTFIAGVTSHTSKSNPLDLTRTALSVLKTLPAAKDAILECFCTTFDVAVNSYVVRIETEIATGQMPDVSVHEESIISEIHSVLCSFVSANPEAWAPIISTWSLELLGELSSKYAGRAHVSGLNETLQLWMDCRATHTLIDITTQCLTCLMHYDTESCISALLDTSIKHSPNFDWVVAHVGSCFPNTVITRVLSVGLKDFCQHKSVEQGGKAPKLISVVGILGHLAGSHFADIRTALLDLFNWSLRPYNILDLDVKAQKVATVPFLLQLASMSPTLLKALSSNVGQTVTISVIPQLVNLTPDWCKYFGSAQSLQDLLIHLILGCEQGGVQVIKLLLDCVLSEELHSSSTTIIRDSCREIIEYLIQEINMLVRTQRQNCSINLLNSLVADIGDVQFLLLSSEEIVYETAARICVAIGSLNPSLLVKTTSYLLQRSKTDEHLSVLVRMLCSDFVPKKSEPCSNYGGYLGEILEQTLLETKRCGHVNDYMFADDVSIEQLWLNILTLLRWENSGKIFSLRPSVVSRALFVNMLEITRYFGDVKVNMKVLHLIAEIIDSSGLLSNKSTLNPPSQQLQIGLTNAMVEYFFLCCKETDPFQRIKGTRITCSVLKKLCAHSKACRIFALRELLERSLFHKESLLFGAVVEDNAALNETKLLLQKNQKQSTTMLLTQRLSSIFHSGVIGQGKRKPINMNPFSQETITSNTNGLIKVIKSCCCLAPQNETKDEPSKKSPLHLEALTHVSLLLVHFVSPDVMYNGLPWPEEEFTKVTIERDLHIRRLFTKLPLLWQLMTFVATYRPTLSYCSVLLRALTATLLHQWNSTGQQSNSPESTDRAALLETTVRVLDLMALGQLLPPPLSSMRDVIPFLKANEIAQLLRECIWNYTRDHIPSPALFGCDVTGLHWRDPTIARPPSPYTDALRLVMLKNIDKVGKLYSQMFVDVPSPD